MLSDKGVGGSSTGNPYSYPAAVITTGVAAINTPGVVVFIFTRFAAVITPGAAVVISTGVVAHITTEVAGVVPTFPQVTEQADQAAVIQAPGGHRAWLQGRREIGSGRIRLHFHKLCTWSHQLTHEN